MTKILLRKQFRELLYLLSGGRNGKRRSAKGTIILFIVIGVVCMASMFAASFGIAHMLFPQDLHGLYFITLALLGTLLATIGSVFTTYSFLYKAKDNDILFSMPIPPRSILVSRIIVVFSISFGWLMVVWLPAMVVYWIFCGFEILQILCSLLDGVMLALFVTTLSALLGFLVAFIASRIHSKNIAITISSLLGIGVYYFGYTKLQQGIRSLAETGQIWMDKIHGSAYVIYAFGVGACGDIGLFLLPFAIVLLLFGLLVLLLSRTFISVATTNIGEKKHIYKEKKISAKSVSGALLSKELRRFFKTPVYFLNCGLGIFILPVVMVVFFLNPEIREIVTELSKMGIAGLGSFIVVMITFIPSLILSTNAISAPSISLEGSNLWILQTSPLDPREILRAKVKLAFLINGPFGILCTIVLGIFFRFYPLEVLASVLFAGLFLLFGAYLGVILNLQKPVLDWPNETYPVKQSLSVLFTMLISWGALLVFGVLAWFTKAFLSAPLFLFIGSLLIIFVIWQMNTYISGKGSRRFSELS